MENIVHNFAKISFQPIDAVLTENRSAAPIPGWNLKPMATTSSTVSHSISVDMLESEQSDEIDSQPGQGADSDDNAESESSTSNNYGHRGGVSRRRMPARIAKDHFNRVSSSIMKTTKRKRKELSTNEQTLRSIEKIYTSKRLKKFTPANLETIFEEPSDENAADAEDDSEECAITSQVQVVSFGSRKLRRSISFNDGLNKNKNLIKKRRLKVKKTFGKRFALKKISMTEFHDRLNKSFDSAMFEDDEAPGCSADSTLNVTKSAPCTFMDDTRLPRLGRHNAFDDRH